MSHKAGWIVLVVMTGGLGWMAWAGQQAAPVPDDHGASLIAACQEALDHCDADAFIALIYTGSSPEAQDLSAHRQVFEMDCKRSIQSITIDPLTSTDMTSYELRGVRYRPTHPPEGMLVIHFASDPGAAVHDETTTLIAGRADGHWRILTAEPDR